MYNHEAPNGTPADSFSPIIPENLITDTEPTLDEIKAVIKVLKTGKAAGIDNVRAEALIAGGEQLEQHLHSLICIIWQSEQIPISWKKAIVVPVLKKGDSSVCKSNRGISLLSILAKVFTKIIQLRLQNHREETSREEQAGFRPNRGCCDQIFTLKQLLEKRVRCGKRLVIVFVDFRAAFDSVHWPALWRSLHAEHIPEKVMHLLQNMYNNSSSCVRVGNVTSDEFSIKTGVRQGCVISPLLFNTVVDAIMRKVFNDKGGIQYGAEGFITDLMFADDSAIFAESDAEATNILHDIAIVAEPYGLKINSDKTKVLTSDGSPAIVFLNNLQIEQVKEFKYLGSYVQEKKIDSSFDIQNRIGQASTAFGSLNWCIWKKNNISLQTKMRLYRSIILPILLYGSETWTTLKIDLKKLEVFQMQCLRRILGVSLLNHLHNETIRVRCNNQPKIEEIVQHRRLLWFGHLCRMNEERIPHNMLWKNKPDNWKISSSAPKKTWLKQIDNDLKNSRISVEEAKIKALDRRSWKTIVRNVHNPAAPTTAYWLRGQPRPTAS